MPKNSMLETKSLLKEWRDERAFRVGTTISWAGLFFGLFASMLDIYFDMPMVVLLGDAVLLLGCAIAIHYSRQEKKQLHFVWVPLYMGVWVGTFTSLLVTGGINSPFLGGYMALLFVGGMIIQSRIRPLWVILFSLVNLIFWFGIEIYSPHSFGTPPPILFNFLINGIVICALMVYVYEFLKTESKLVEQTTQRFQELENTRKRAAKEEQANAAKSAFLANISHELRTPLGAILGYAELLQDETLDQVKRNEFSNTILRNGQQLAHLVNDLLDLTKVEAGKIELENIEFKPNQILLEVIELLRLQAQKKNLSLSLTYKEQVPDRLISDPTRIKQVLMNVIGNAIKFTEKGEVNVRVYFNNSASLLSIEVQDSGVGMTKDEQKKLFRPFSQADASICRKFGGTGLGLSLSKKLAQLMGGDLELAWSLVGKGSQFNFKLPVQVASVQSSMRPSAQLHPRSEFIVKPSPAHLLAGLRILLVDDTPDSQKLISLYLTKTGAQVDLASDGSEAVQIATAVSYDLILMDVQMPVMDGLQAATLLRKNSFSKPLIALTAHAMKEDRDRCLAAGFDDYLTKPIDKEILVQKIKAVMSLGQKKDVCLLP